MTASAIFTAAHAAARLADAVVAYRTRFATALRAAWAAAKQAVAPKATAQNITLQAINKQGKRFNVVLTTAKGERTATATLLGEAVRLAWQDGQAYVSVSQATMRLLFGASVGANGVMIALSRNPEAEIAAIQQLNDGPALFGAAYARHFEMNFMSCSAEEAS